MMPFDATQLDMDEAAMLAAFADGDAAAASALTARLAPKVFALSKRMLGDTAEAEDVTQEAMLKLWNIAPKWDADRAKVSTWLYRVASNLCIDRLRKSKRTSGDEMPEIADETPSVSHQMQQRERADALNAALLQLPDRQRQVVILRHIEGLSNPEIAEIMESSVEAIESLTARGKRSLAALLAPQKEKLGLSDG